MRTPSSNLQLIIMSRLMSSHTSFISIRIELLEVFVLLNIHTTLTLILDGNDGTLGPPIDGRRKRIDITLSFSFNLTFLFLISFSGFSAGNPKDGVWMGFPAVPA